MFLFLKYYASLISNGPVENSGTTELPNKFPINSELKSPYGPIWLEWQLETSKTKMWEVAVQQEMFLLRNLVLAGWMKADEETPRLPKAGALPRYESAVSDTSDDSDDSDVTVSPHSHPTARSYSMGTMPSPYATDAFSTPSRRASDAQTPSRTTFTGLGEPGVNSGLIMRALARPQSRPFSHRNTLSSPTCLPSSGDPFLG